MSSYKQGDILAISYDVWISGTQLGMDKKECITSIEVKETVEGADSATIQITDPEFRYIEDNIFLEENEVKIQLGWSGTSYRVEFNGYISAIDITFDSDGMPKVTATCMDNTHKMNRQKKDRTFKDTTSAAVVQQIVQEYGFSCVVDSTYEFKVQETITQSHQTDIEFITKLAGDEVYPFTARLVDSTFYYVKMGKLESPKMSLTYRNYPHEIISFSPQINKESKQVEIKSSSIDTATKATSDSVGTVDSNSGSSSNSSKNGKNNSYTYNPQTKSWSKN